MFFSRSNRSRTSRRPLKPFILPARWNGARLCLEALEDRSMLSFLGPVNYAVGSTPQAVASADFNNDGQTDLAVANSGSNTVGVLLGNGNGTFQPARYSTAGTWPVSLSVGDLNADGKLDLVTRNYTGETQSLNVLLGNGNGTFESPRNIPNVLGSTPAVGDVDADGKPDLVTVWSESVDGGGRVSTRLGRGDGTFAAPVIQVLDYSYLTAGVLQDFNADGKLDLAASDLGHGVRVLRGNGDGTFGAPADYASSGASSIIVGDANGDGISDLITNASVLLGNGSAGVGDGTFRSAQSVALNGGPYSPLALGDFNADGNLDLVATSNYFTEYPGDYYPPGYWTGSVHVLLGYGDGTFGPPRPFTVEDSHLSALATGDLNGDGFSDVAVTSLDFNNVLVLLDDGFWPLYLSVDGVTVTEGNAGATNAVFTVRPSPNPAQTVTVNYTTVNGSATAGSDYLATSGTLTYLPGGTLSQTITVPVLGDTLAEAEAWSYPLRETFFIKLTNTTDTSLALGTSIGTILDDEPWVSFYGITSVTEGDVGTSDAVFTLKLSAPSPVPVTVGYATYDYDDGSFDYPATAGSDYEAAAGTVTFAPGTTTQAVTVKVLGDTIPEGGYGTEPSEFFGVKLTSSEQAHTSGGNAPVVILDDDSSVCVNPVTVSEGNSGAVDALFWVTLFPARGEPVTVHYSAADGSATAGSDYVATSGTMTFAPGETMKPITVPVKGDRLVEANESFFVNLSQATNATIANGQAQGSINDDEPRISINDVTRYEGRKNKTTLFTFTVTLSAAYDQSVTMSFATANGTATTGDNDYIAKTGTLTFNPGETTKTITIEVKGDSKKETDETFMVLLFGASNNAWFLDILGLGTILNDD